MSSGEVFAGLASDIMIDYTSFYDELINVWNSSVLIYAGDFDILTGPATLEERVRGISLPDYDAFWG